MNTYPNPTMVERKCKCCGNRFKARKADVDRGWARFCSKSCKATHQTRKTGVGREGRMILPGGTPTLEDGFYDPYKTE